MIAFVATMLLALAPPDDPKPPKPPTKKELAAIEARGRLLAGYDNAAWHASDAIQAQMPKEGAVEGFVARKTKDGWVVSFGRLDPNSKNYLVAYEATSTAKPDAFDVEAFEPPKKVPGFERAAAEATRTALKDFTEHFQGERRPYNVAVIPGEGKELLVYFVPAPTQPGIWPLGGDVRYRMSPDGSKVVEKRQLHKAIIENPPPADAGDNKLVSGMHNHVLSDIPEDTDVFHVLTRKPAIGEMIVTGKFVYGIKPDGAIQYLGTAEEVLKKK